MQKFQNNEAVHDAVINEQNRTHQLIQQLEEQAHHNFSECLECTQVEKKAQNLQVLSRLEKSNHGKQCSLLSTRNKNRCIHKCSEDRTSYFEKKQRFQKQHNLCQGAIMGSTVWGILV